MNISWLLLFLPTIACGVCPLCTLAVGAGVGLSRWLAIDDLISGLWIGALLLSLSLWLIKWLRSKQLAFAFSLWAIPCSIALIYTTAIAPLYWAGLMGSAINQWHGVDRLLAGIILGTFIFIGGLLIHAFIKIRHGHVLIPFQKVIIPTLVLTLTSIVLYFVIRR